MTDIPASPKSDTDLGKYGRIAVGCLGGFLAAVGGTLLADQANLANSSDMTEEGAWLIGLLGRVVFTTMLGGLWVWLNTQETDRLRVLQAGLIAPAMFSAMLLNASPNLGNESEVDSTPVAIANMTERRGAFVTVPISTASLVWAGDEKGRERSSTLKCIISGFLGQRC